MTDLRKLARDRECTVRVPGTCRGGTETVVLAHIRLIGISGSGLKAPDIFAAYCCFPCHMCCDGHDKSDWTVAERRLMLLEGMVRTQQILIDEGILSW